MNNKIKSSTETWNNEDLTKIQFRIRNSYLVSYDLKVQPHEEIIYDEKIAFNTVPTLNIEVDRDKAYIDFAARSFRNLDAEKEGKDILCSIVTRTEFDLKGIPYNEIRPDYGEIKVPHAVLLPLVSIALSSTRGIWSLISGGKFILPALDPTQYKFSGNAIMEDEITPPSFPSTEP